MKFMVMVKATKDSEAGRMPSTELIAAMGRFNEDLVKAGVMQAGEGLHPSSKGRRVRFSAGDERTVIDGPFAETKELVAGFWLWECASLDEAVAWVKRCPRPMEGECEIEIRQLYSAEDFGEAFTPELRAQEEQLRDRIAKPVQAVPPAAGATPYLVVKGVDDAIAWYRKVFGAELVVRLAGPDGSVIHSHLQVGPAQFFMTEESPQWNSLGPKTRGGSSTTAILYVPDADATFQKALDNGATVGMPMGDQFWGDRSGSLTDPFGHQWFISTHREDLTPEQIQERMAALMAGGTSNCG
jgi:uncharacterized glyoxalase superfamily protein PhnB